MMIELILDALLGSPARRAERRRRKAHAWYCRKRFGRNSRAYHRAVASARGI